MILNGNDEIKLDDTKTEESMIESLMTSGYLLPKMIGRLDEECFMHPECKAIFRALKRVSEQKGGYDQTALNSEIAKEEGMSWKTPYEVMYRASPVTDWEGMAIRLIELKQRRQICLAGLRLYQRGRDEANLIPEIVADLLKEIESLDGTEQSKITTAAEQREKLMQRMLENARREKVEPSTPTGFKELDERGGFQPGDLIIVAAETSVGKTSFATKLAIEATQRGQGVAFYSMEMTAEQITSRIMAMQASINARQIMNGKMSDAEILKAYHAMDGIRPELLHFDDTSTSSLEQILNSIRAMKQKTNLAGVVVDYLQILNTNQRTANKEQAMGEAARKLKNLAKELGIWVIALSQLSRDRANPMPTLSRLRDSGQIEEAADTVILIHRPKDGNSFASPYEAYDPKQNALIMIAKGRNIGVFDFMAKFEPEFTRFGAEAVKGGMIDPLSPEAFDDRKKFF